MRRTHLVKTFLNDDEMKSLLNTKGSARPGTHLRRCFLSSRSSEIPALNLEAWRVLSKCAGSLEQLAKSSVIGRADADALKTEINVFRDSLIRAGDYERST